jgi:hypothetical protein
MQENKSITSWEAIERFGATRLSAIIFNLKDKYNITTTREEFIDRYGNKSHYARYTLLGKRDLNKEANGLLDWMRIR